MPKEKKIERFIWRYPWLKGDMVWVYDGYGRWVLKHRSDFAAIVYEKYLNSLYEKYQNKQSKTFDVEEKRLLHFLDTANRSEGSDEPVS